MQDFKRHIAHCFEFVEHKLSRGSMATWDTNDFRILSEAIHLETGTLLSVSTLKRLSGRAHYSSKPHGPTLNALAKYIGFDNWRAFLTDSEPVNFVEIKNPTKRFKWVKYGITFLLAVLALSAYLFFKNRVTYYNPNDFAFSVKSVTTGLPNSVVFRYDASTADKKAKIEIQQDWDERKRVTVNRNDSISTSIYYWPGYFKSKLVVNDSIVKEKNVFIPTSDWMATIETDSLPIYLNNKDFKNGSTLSINPEILEKYGVNPYQSKTIVGLYQIRDFGELYTDNFEFNTLFQNDFKSGSAPCQRTQVVIMHEDGPISIPICNKGCISDISLFAFGEQVNGKKNDLSMFGVDFTNNIELKCISKDQKLTIFIDGKQVYSFNVPKPLSKIIGVCVFFEGAGSIKTVEFKRNREKIYELTAF